MGSERRAERQHHLLRTILVLAILSVSVVVAPASPASATTSIPTLTAISARAYHTCGLTTGGGLKCWGYNVDGELGNGTNTDSNIPVDVSGLTSGVSAVAAGTSHTCALTTGGGVKCWGYNVWGQLGNATNTDSKTPINVSGLTSGTVAVAAGNGATCALTTGGGVKCWGYNLYGELGDGTNTNSSVPVSVSGLASGVAAISTSGFHTCAVTTGGGVKCWGRNVYGELGDGSNTDSNVPVSVAGLASGVAAVSTGQYHTCAVTTGGGAKCWGYGGSFALGDGSSGNSNVPVDVSRLGSGVASISAGWGHTCAVTTGGGVKCWGYNQFGQLGNGTNTDSKTPIDVSGLASGIASIGAGAQHTCVLMATGGAKCWGDNNSGELGSGSGIFGSSLPVDVVWYHSSLTFTASPTTLNPGETTTTLSGDLNMGGYGTLLGQTIQVTRTNPDSTITPLSTTTDSAGHYSLDDVLIAPGLYHYAATWIPDAVHGPPGSIPATVLVNRNASSLTLKASAKVVPYKGKVKLTVHLASPTYAQDINHIVDLAVTPAGKSTVITPITVNTSGDGSITFSLTRTTSFKAFYPGDAYYARVVTGAVKVGVSIKVPTTALNFYGTSGVYHLYHYASTCPSSHKGCPTFVIQTKPAQSGGYVNLQMQAYVSGAWHTALTAKAKLNAKGWTGVIIYYSSNLIEGKKLRLRGIFKGTKKYATSTGPWCYFEVTR